MEIKSQTNHIECLGSLERSQWLSRAEILEIQAEKMRALLRHAYDTVPFYNRRFKQVGLKPEAIRTVDQLVKLPRLTKQEIRNNLPGLISSAIPKRKLVPFATGGSTGEPLRFFKDKRTISWAEAATSRGYRWAGLDLGDKYIILWGSLFDLSTSKKISGILHSHLMRYIILQSSDMSERSMATYVRIVRKFKPKAIKGYASALVLFANYLRKKGISDMNLRSVISTAENLSLADRGLLEEQFNCDVYDTYGSREIAMMAGECPQHCGLHISAETVVLEFEKEDEIAASGELGEILVTDLHNYGMPLIRYSIGDAGRPTHDLCSCGRGLPLMKSVDGRTTDCVRASDGRYIPGPGLTLIFSDLPVKKYQIVQRELVKLTIRVIRDTGYSQFDDQKIVSRIKQLVGCGIEIEIAHVNDIPCSLRSGKFLPVISQIEPFE
jgi:phenylacetate-CoA ligase